METSKKQKKKKNLFDMTEIGKRQNCYLIQIVFDYK